MEIPNGISAAAASLRADTAHLGENGGDKLHLPFLNPARLNH
jgi:hypothetical protein